MNYSLVVSINVISAQWPTKRRRTVDQSLSRRQHDQVTTRITNRSWCRQTYLKTDKEDEEEEARHDHIHIPSSVLSLSFSSYQPVLHLSSEVTRNRRTWRQETRSQSSRDFFFSKQKNKREGEKKWVFGIELCCLVGKNKIFDLFKVSFLRNGSSDPSKIWHCSFL